MVTKLLQLLFGAVLVVSSVFTLANAASVSGYITDPTFYDRMFHKYLDLNDIFAYLNTAANNFSTILHLETIGLSHQGQSLMLAKIGNQTFSGDKPSIWIDGAMHGREWVSPSVSLYIIDTLIRKSRTDPLIASYVNKINWFILPVMNPDGYVFSRSENEGGFKVHFDWRKNRRPPACDKPGLCCYGVDLNRNFGFQWGGTHSTNDSCHEEYRGPQPFSEPESIAVRDYVLRNTNTLKAFITLHSFGQLWLYPYGYEAGTYPENKDDLDRTAYNAIEALKAVYGTKYMAGSAADIYYPSSGTSGDWAKGVANIPYVYAIELRPARYTVAGFIGNSYKVADTAEETWAGLRVVVDEILAKWGGGGARLHTK